MKEHSSLKRAAKIVIAIVVVIGLTMATRKAMQQWREQQTQLESLAAELDTQLANATDPEQRKQLLERRDAALRSVPRLRNLDWPRIGVAALLYLGSLVPGGVVLAESCRAVGHRVSIRDAIAAQILGHLGKYVPGKAMVVVMRAGRLNAAGVPLINGSIAVVMETLLMMAVGAAISGVLVLWLPVPRWIAISAFAGATLALVPTLPPVFRRVLTRLGKQSNKTNLDSPWRYFAQAWIWQSINWLLIGAAFSCLVTSLPGEGETQNTTTVVLACTASIALAMVAGFVSLLPGGAGVRELTLAMVLSPIVGQPQALLGAIAARFLFIAVELFAAALVYRTNGNEEPATTGAAAPHSPGRTP